jgi:dienelactone hydrolase
VPRDYRKVTPVADAEFAIYRRLFDYDVLPLDARRDTAGVGEQYRWEKVSFVAAYGRERMSAYIFLPKDATPPYPAVLYWPHTGAIVQRASDPKGFAHSFESYLGFIPRSGRALVMPVFKGTFHRSDSAARVVMELPDSTTYARDITIQRIKDLRRTVDYLQTRSDVIGDQLGYYGWSWGGGIAPIVLGVEPRIRAAVLHVGGLYPTGVVRPEIDAVNYLPRARAPTLMLNGRYDVVFPYESSQLPFFRLLGAPAVDKKHVVYPSSHTVPQADVVRETLAWFDKYLGPPVRRR